MTIGHRSPLPSPPRHGASAPALLVVALGAIAAGATGGCAVSSTYRVPGLEVQRLANLPPEERSNDIRVVPETAPLYPSTQRLAPPPPPVVAPPPAPPGYGPDVVVVDEQPPVVVVEPGVYVDVAIPIGGGHPRVGPPPYGASGRPPPRVAPPPARAGFVGTPVSSGGGLRGSPPAATAPRTSGWRGSPVGSAPRTSVPPRASVPRSSGGGHVGGGGGHHGGGGGGSDAAVAVGAAVAIVGLIALAAVAADANAKAERARTFDGWVNVNPSHPLLLHYSNNYERTVPLDALQPRDAIGVQYAVLSSDDGDVELKAPQPVAVRPAAAAAPPVARAMPPASTLPATPAPPPAAVPSAPAPAYTPAPPPPVPPAPPAAPAQPTS